MKIRSVFTVLVFTCIVLSGCAAYKGDLTREKAYGAIDKFMAGKGTFTIMADDTDEYVKAGHARAFKPGSDGGEIYFDVSNFTGTDTEGKSWTIPEGSGIASFIKYSSDHGWYLTHIYITPKGGDPTKGYSVFPEQAIY